MTFDGVPSSLCRMVHAGWPRPVLAEKYQTLDKQWLSYEQKRSAQIGRERQIS